MCGTENPDRHTVMILFVVFVISVSNRARAARECRRYIGEVGAKALDQGLGMLRFSARELSQSVNEGSHLLGQFAMRRVRQIKIVQEFGEDFDLRADRACSGYRCSCHSGMPAKVSGIVCGLDQPRRQIGDVRQVLCNLRQS